MKQKKKFECQEQQTASEALSQQTTLREFTSVEELLRYDAKQTNVPRVVAERLSQSLQNQPRPSRSWWQRWFGKK